MKRIVVSKIFENVFYFRWHLLVKVGICHALFLLISFILFQFASCKNEIFEQEVKVKIVSAEDISDISPESPAKDRTNFVDPDRKNPSHNSSQNAPIKPVIQTKERLRYRTPQEIRKSRPKETTRIKPEAKRIPIDELLKEVDITSINESIDQNSDIESVVNREIAERLDFFYHQQISDILYELWKQPSKTEVGGRALNVTIQISIDRNGRVLDKKIVGQSKNHIMNSSVARLLSELNSVPAFPKGLDLDTIKKTIVLELQ